MSFKYAVSTNTKITCDEQIIAQLFERGNRTQGVYSAALLTPTRKPSVRDQGENASSSGWQDVFAGWLVGVSSNSPSAAAMRTRSGMGSAVGCQLAKSRSIRPVVASPSR